MERLPSLLMSTIQNACEQFRNIQFTVHGENDRARISIVFSNQDKTVNKRKSKATVQRDNKRLKEYVAELSDIQQTVERNIEIQQTITSEVQSVENMITNNTGSVQASDQILRTIKPVENNITPKKNSNTKDNVVPSREKIKRAEKSSSKNSKTVNSRDSKPVDKSVSDKCNDMEVVDSEQTKPKQICSLDTYDDIDSYYAKIVIKCSRTMENLLIGQNVFQDKLVLFGLDSRTFEIIDSSDPRYWKYEKSLVHDFKDIRKTDGIYNSSSNKESDIKTMLEFAIENKL